MANSSDSSPPPRSVVLGRAVWISESKRFLAPRLAAAVEPLEDLMLTLAQWSLEEPDAGIPDALGPPAAAAVGTIRQALDAADYRNLYTPDGDYEHEPLAVVVVASAPIAALGAAVVELAAALLPGGNPVVVDALDDPDTVWTPQKLVERAARLHGLCDLAWGDDQQLVADRLIAARGLAVVVLTDVEEAAYGRVRDRLVAMWHDFDPLERWAY